MLRRCCACALILLLMFSFASCSNNAYPVKIEDSGIDKGLYAYYLSGVINEESPTDKAKELCREYVACEKFADKLGITLSTNYKREVADATEKQWNLFSQYYESIGVTKQDITKAQTHEYRKKELLNYYYGEKGKKPLSDDEMKEEFVKVYVGFKAIEASFLKLNDMGERVEIAESEKKSLEKTFTSMAKRINEGSMTIDEANESYNESIGLIVTQPLGLTLVKDGDPLYGDDFFSQVSEISHGKAGVVKSGNSIYLILRQTIASSDEDAYILYRSEILEKMRMPKIDKKIADEAKEYELQENEKLTREIHEIIKNKVAG